MEANPFPPSDSMFIDKDALSGMLDEADVRSGFVYDPTATPHKAWEMMQAQGVRAEDNLRHTQAVVDVCVLVAADGRLLKVAAAEGLKALNPELLPAADVPAFLAAL